MDMAMTGSSGIYVTNSKYADVTSLQSNKVQ